MRDSSIEQAHEGDFLANACGPHAGPVAPLERNPSSKE